MDKTNLAKRIKAFQAESDYRLPTRGYTILQLDGQAFHTWTKGFEKPFDARFVNAMNETAIEVMKNVSNVRFAFVQSDEINILLTDFERGNTQAYFANRIQKVVSTSAALASASLTRAFPEKSLATFDARFFAVPTKEDVADFFIWRQADAIKNSVRSVGHSHFSSRALHGKNTSDAKAMLTELGDPWEGYSEDLRQGRLIQKVKERLTTTFEHKRTGESKTISYDGFTWKNGPAPLFREEAFLEDNIPVKP